MNSTAIKLLKLTSVGLVAAAILAFVWVAYLPSAEVAVAASGVSGTVQKPDGTTLAEQVNINCFGQTGGNGTQSASNGTFNLSLNPGRYKCQAQPQPTSTYSPSVEAEIDVFTDQTTTLNPKVTNAQLKGKCFKPDGVTGMRCNINVHSQDFSIFAHANADDTGNYKLGGLANGTYVAEAQPDFSVSGLTPPDPATVTLGSTVVEKNFTFVTAAKKITGTVKKTDGTAAANANVNAFRMNGQGFANGQIDSSGTYTISVSGGSWNVQPFCGGGPGSSCDWIYQNPPTIVDFANDTTSETKTVDFAVTTASATITGTVKDKNNVPVTQGNLDIRTQDGRGTGTQLGADGSFSVKTTAGTYNVFLWTQTNAYALPPTTVTVADGETKTLALTVTAKTAKISGKVATASGAGAGNVDVNAFQMVSSGPGGPGPGGPGGSFSNTRTKSDGTYELFVTSGNWNVHLGFGPGSTFVPANPKPCDVAVASETSTVSATDYSCLNMSVVQTDAKITGRVLDASSNQPVTNFFGCAFARAVGTFSEQCSPIQNGTFTINVSSTVSTSWEVGVHTPPNSDYSGSTPQKVTVAANGTAQADVQLVKNNSSIFGKIVDSTGFPLSTCDFRGMVFANGVSGQFYQGEVQKDCSYRIGLVAGNYNVGTHFDPKSGAMNKPPSPEDQVLVLSGQNAEKNISLVIGDATITGTCLDANGKPLRCFVHADNVGEIHESRELKHEGGPGPGGPGGPPRGADRGFDKKMPCDAKDINGVIKCCSDAKNKAACQAFPVPDGPNGCKNAYDCVQQCKSNPQICEDAKHEGEPSGPQAGQDFTGPGGCKSEEECKTYCSKPENFKTCSEFKPPSGAQSIRVRATAEGPSSSASKGTGGPAGFDNAIRAGSESDANGNFTLKVLSGHIYQVRVGFPPESGLMPPKEVRCDLTSVKSCNVSLQARTADATIEGKVTISQNPAERCFVHGWAEDAGFSGSPCTPGGQYKLNVTKGTTWHVCGDSFDGSKFYRCKDEASIVISTEKKIKLDIPLEESHFRVPEPVTTTFTCTDPTTLALEDGTTINVPASTVSTDDGTCSITATPTVDLGSSKSAQRIGVAYDVSARDENGAQVTDLKNNVTIKMVLPEDGLTAEGIDDVSAVLAANYNSSTSSYDIKSNATVKEEDCPDDASEDCVTITFTTDHFSAYAAVNTSGSTSTLKKVTTATSKNKTSFTVGSKKVTPFSCQKAGETVTVKTKQLGSQQLIVAGATCDSSLKVYNTSGKLVKKLSPGFAVASMVLADVTQDGKNDIVVGSSKGKVGATAFDVNKKYKKYRVDAGTGTAYATVVNAFELNTKGTLNLVTGTMANQNASPTNVKSWKFSKSKFSTTAAALSSFLKASKGSIDLSVPKPTVASVKGTVSTSSSSSKLTVKGKNLTPDTTVVLCTLGGTVKFKSTKELQVTFDGTALSAGKCNLTVTNSDGKTSTKKNAVTVK